MSGFIFSLVPLYNLLYSEDMNKDGFWDLTPLYKNYEDETFKKELSLLPVEISKLSDLIRGKNYGTGNLENILVSLQDIERLFTRLSNFVELNLAVNATSEDSLLFQDKLNSFQPQIESLWSGLSRFFAGFGKQKDFEETINNSGVLKSHDFFIREMIESGNHLLPANVEDYIFEMKRTGSSAWEQLRDMLDGVSTVEIDLDGIKTLPLPEIRNMAYSENPEIRKKAYYAELASYKKTEIPIAFALHSIKAESLYLSKLKGFDSLLAETLFNSRMKKETLFTMLEVIRENLGIFHRYYRLKSRILGHKNGLPFYDLFAPLGKSEQKFTVDSARKLLVKVFSDFDGEYGAFIDNAFENDWIDFYPREGKGGGAFCSTLHSERASRVMTNFTGTFSDVSTLAHELGHAFHDSCLYNESILNSDYPMPLAETASTFNEIMLSQTCLSTMSGNEALAILDSQISDWGQSIVDIYSRFLFETKVVETCGSHRMSVKELQSAMTEAQKQAYGEGLDPSFLHPDMWVCKCHYYSTAVHFYNFPYAFGLLLALGLFQMYKTDNKNFIGIYKKFLSLTGTNTIEETTKKAGIDITKKEFWQRSFNQIEKTIDEFEALCKENLPGIL